MEKSCHSSTADSTISSSNSNSNYNQHQHQNNSSNSNYNQHQHHNSSSGNNNNNPRDQYLKQLNKFSHKISKDSRPPSVGKYPLEIQHNQQQQQQQQQQSQQQQQLQQQHQPPVYNINKNDFRDVVQKLTGSPAHERNFSTPPPIHPPKPQSSRLQRIRPPPLAHLSPRPPPPLTNTILPPATTTTTTAVAAGGAANVATLASNAVNINNAGNFVGNNNGRPVTPLSPLPAFPSVHAAAESPISAYMRYLQGSMSTFDSEPKRFSSGPSPLVSPRWNTPNSLQPQVSPRWNNNYNTGPIQPQPPQPQPQQQIPFPPSTAAMSPSQFLMPSSPLAFGKLPSPRSPYPLLSPTFLFSPTSGQLGFPQFSPSPRLPISSPRWRDL